MRNKKIFIKILKEELGEQIGCGLQHNGWPCNSCFHSWAENNLGLHPHLAHQFWLITLAIRGDHTKEEIKEAVLDEKAKSFADVIGNKKTLNQTFERLIRSENILKKKTKTK